MAVNLSSPNPSQLYPIQGLRIGVTEAGIRKANRKDLTIVLIDEGASVSGVFTQNRFFCQRSEPRPHFGCSGICRH